MHQAFRPQVGCARRNSATATSTTGALWEEGYQEPPAGLRESLAEGLLRL
jgi:hypothetical protein